MKQSGQLGCHDGVRGMAGVASPDRIRLGRGGATQRIALRQPPGLGVTAFRLLDLRQQQPQATLVDTGRDGGLGMAAGLAGQAGLERGARQQQAALEMVGIGLGQPPRGLRALQRVAHRLQRERGQVRLRRDAPTVADHRERSFLSPRRTQAGGIGQRGRSQRWIIPPGLPRQAERTRGFGLGLRRCNGERRLGRVRVGQREGVGPVAGPYRQPRPLPPQPSRAGLHRLGPSCQGRRLRPVFPLDRLPQQAAQAQKSGIVAVCERAKCALRLIRATGDAPRLCRQQQGRGRVAQQPPGAAGLAAGIAGLGGGQRQQRAGDRDVAGAPPPRRLSLAQRARQADQGAEQAERGVEHDEQQQQAERHHRRGSLEAESPISAVTRPGRPASAQARASTTPPTSRTSRIAAHQPGAAHAASAALASSSARAWASHVGHRLRRRALAARRPPSTRPHRSPASSAARARSSTPAVGSPTRT